jgi:hypothetical protein
MSLRKKEYQILSHDKIFEGGTGRKENEAPMLSFKIWVQRMCVPAGSFEFPELLYELTSFWLADGILVKNDSQSQAGDFGLLI